jgi:hypothetical protein
MCPQRAPQNDQDDAPHGVSAASCVLKDDSPGEATRRVLRLDDVPVPMWWDERQWADRSLARMYAGAMRKGASARA